MVSVLLVDSLDLDLKIRVFIKIIYSLSFEVFGFLEASVKTKNQRRVFSVFLLDSLGLGLEIPVRVSRPGRKYSRRLKAIAGEVATKFNRPTPAQTQDSWASSTSGWSMAVVDVWYEGRVLTARQLARMTETTSGR